jgi:hypothetical protein
VAVAQALPAIRPGHVAGIRRRSSRCGSLRTSPVRSPSRRRSVRACPVSRRVVLRPCRQGKASPCRERERRVHRRARRSRQRVLAGDLVSDLAVGFQPRHSKQHRPKRYAREEPERVGRPHRPNIGDRDDRSTIAPSQVSIAIAQRGTTAPDRPTRRVLPSPEREYRLA